MPTGFVVHENIRAARCGNCFSLIVLGLRTIKLLFQLLHANKFCPSDTVGHNSSCQRSDVEGGKYKTRGKDNKESFLNEVREGRSNSAIGHYSDYKPYVHAAVYHERSKEGAHSLWVLL